MVGKIVIGFLGLVFLFFVIEHPGQLVEIMQMIVDAAQRMAHGLSHLDLNSGEKS